MTVLANPYVLGYHGCDRSIGEAILRGGQKHLKLSKNSWDWLGRGIYFWEADPLRGYEWAVENCAKSGFGEPMVIGAVIHLGNCLNLMDRASLMLLSDSFEQFRTLHQSAYPQQPLPVNDARKRHALDCQVINHLHMAIDEARNSMQPGITAPTPYNTVRGLYQEDDAVFPGSMVKERTHIQISVLTPEDSIQGYFRVPEGQYR